MRRNCVHKWSWVKHSTYRCPKQSGGCGAEIYGGDVAKILRAFERVRASIKSGKGKRR